MSVTISVVSMAVAVIVPVVTLARWISPVPVVILPVSVLAIPIASVAVGSLVVI